MIFSAPPTDSDVFAALRPRLFSIAYRMLGTRTDAEDVLQDAWLRWHRADHAALQSAEAWLVTVVTRLAIDRLRAASSSLSPMICAASSRSDSGRPDNAQRPL